MNHTYRLVWNEAAQRYVPAAESARSRGKSGGRKAQRRLRTIVLVASVGGAYVGSALAGPMQICTSLERKVVVAPEAQFVFGRMLLLLAAPLNVKFLGHMLGRVSRAPLVHLN